MAAVNATVSIQASMTAGGRDKTIYMLILRQTLDVWSEFLNPYEMLKR